MLHYSRTWLCASALDGPSNATPLAVRMEASQTAEVGDRSATRPSFGHCALTSALGLAQVKPANSTAAPTCTVKRSTAIRAANGCEIEKQDSKQDENDENHHNSNSNEITRGEPSESPDAYEPKGGESESLWCVDAHCLLSASPPIFSGCLLTANLSVNESSTPQHGSFSVELAVKFHRPVSPRSL